MATRVVMPKLGLSMKTGVISSWKAADGTSVKAGQTLFVVETEKVNMEIAAEADGVLRRLESEGSNVVPGHLIGYILAPGDDLPAASVPAAPGAPPAPPPSRDGATAAAPHSALRVVASPVARKLAEQLGVDLATIVGTGPGGRVIKEDVEATVASGNTPEAPQQGTAPSTRQAMNGMRQAIARRMTESLQTTAQLSMGTEAVADALLELQTELASQTEDDAAAPGIVDIIIFAVVRALAAHPRLNARIEGDEILEIADVHLGFAVALPDGLVVPVVKSAQLLRLSELSRCRRALAAAARAGTLGLDDLSGSTFTLTSLGHRPIRWFTPILNPPEAAILGVGQIYDGPRSVDGQLVPTPLLPLSLTVDHRLVDGAPAADFLSELVANIEKPLRLLT